MLARITNTVLNSVANIVVFGIQLTRNYHCHYFTISHNILRTKNNAQFHFFVRLLRF